MDCLRRTLLSIALLGSLILTVTATGALAQPPDEPQGTRSVEFRNDCAGLDNCFDAFDPVNVVASGDATANSRQTATITIKKDAEPADGTDFPFVSDLGDFKLDDAVPDDGDLVWDSVTFSAVQAEVEYAFVEQLPVFWGLTSIACYYTSSDTELLLIFDGATIVGLSINPVADEEITCTFENDRIPVYPVYLPFVSRNYASP